MDCLLLAVDQQYGFPVSASQRAFVTLTLLHSAPSDLTHWSEPGTDERLISICLLVSIAVNECSVDIYFWIKGWWFKLSYMFYSLLILTAHLPIPSRLSQLSLCHFSFFTFSTILSSLPNCSNLFSIFHFLLLSLFLSVKSQRTTRNLCPKAQHLIFRNCLGTCGVTEITMKCLCTFIIMHKCNSQHGL